ncbi:MAG TPA: DUF2968 domain-containing protein [Trinickia sp.]|uniref:DUF2968 domain-containing protein n=1 Tax=Trinickia sp. TaxID=2571163 RepID=UPI002F3FF3A2
MRHLPQVRGTALAALVMIGGLGMFGCAGAQSSGSTTAPATTTSASIPLTAGAATPAVATSDASPVHEQAPTASAVSQAEDSKEAAQGNVAELQRLMHGSDLTELRTSYNGSYGASLLLYGKELTYYVALFQQKNFWRVIKTQDEARAEAIYAEFAKKSAQLADVELRGAKLAAQKTYTEHLIALSQARAERLQADLDVAHQQQALAADRQKRARGEAAALDAQKRAAQDQLRALKRQVRELQREADSGLPHRVR